MPWRLATGVVSINMRGVTCVCHQSVPAVLFDRSFSPANVTRMTDFFPQRRSPRQHTSPDPPVNPLPNSFALPPLQPCLEQRRLCIIMPRRRDTSSEDDSEEDKGPLRPVEEDGDAEPASVPDTSR